MLDSFAFSTQLLGDAVRRRGLLSLEEAVHRISNVQARLYGLVGRGVIEVGAHADLVVFDPNRIAPGPVEWRSDLPGGAGRLYGGAIGVDRVIVAGSEIVRDGELTGTQPGRVLRAGKDVLRDHK